VKCRVVNWLVIISLALFAATYWAAFHSYNYPTTNWQWRTAGGSLRLSVQTGDLIIRRPSSGGPNEIPLALFAAVFAVLPTRWLFARMRIRQLKREQTRTKKNREQFTHCVLCGYDLRATPDRCPECGTAPSTLQRLAIEGMQSDISREGS
jgi:hypothetical protein